MADRSFRPIVLILALLVAPGCKPTSESGGTAGVASNANGNSAPRVASSPAPPRNDYESKLEYVRTARFAHIYVFSRPDGGYFTADDITYVKANAPERTNMWVKTDDGRKVLAGTNFEFTPENLDAERKRFNVEDFPGR
ncbi:MAG TPA: hypothetical protein VK619_14250 [Pyrinomonadaceae bacterium]|nr:hypothetical protein [Pyrinomonadaceae bacterium]